MFVGKCFAEAWYISGFTHWLLFMAASAQLCVGTSKAAQQT